MAYTKLFSSIVASSIWSEDDQTRIVWITLLATCDQHGEVAASIPGIARIAGVSIEAAEKAIAKFLAPDPYSRTPDNEGRRIEEIDGGWAVLNYQKYRRMASKDDHREKTAARVRRHRERTGRNAPVTQCNAETPDCNAKSVTCNGDVTHQRDIAEAEAEADLEMSRSASEPLGARAPASVEKVGGISPTLAEIQGYASRNMIAPEIAEAFWHAMEAVDWVDARNRIIRKPESALIGWARNWKENQAKQKTNGPYRNTAKTGARADRNAGTLNDASEYAGLEGIGIRPKSPGV